jgi:hypothetical protein
MTTPQNSIPAVGPRIEVGEGFVQIHDFIIQDADLANSLRGLNRELQIQMMESIISRGIETQRLMNTTAAAESLEKVALKISNDIEEKRKSLVDGVHGIAEQIVAKKGDLSMPEMLATWRDSFKTLLDNQFDPSNTESILTKFDTMIETKSKSQNSEISNKLDFNIETSTINLLQKNIKEHLTAEISSFKEKFEEVTRALGIDSAVTDEKKLQANRGNVFEDVFYDIICELAREKNDTADNPGKRKASGLSGNNEGDVVVTINPESTRGESQSFVIECKLRKDGISDKYAMDQLQLGMDNRGCSVGFIVTDPSNSRTLDDFNFFYEKPNGRAILVVDPIDPDANAIRFAYIWARWMCIREGNNELNTQSVEDAVNEIRQSIESFKTLTTKNTKAINLLSENDVLMESMKKAIARELDGLTKMIEEASEVQD